MNDETHRSEGFGADDALQIDALCEEFETRLPSGERPTIEDFLDRVEERLKGRAFAELLRIEIGHRLETGEIPNRLEYRERFPAFAEEVAEVFDTAFPQADLFERLAGRFEVLEEVGSGGMGIVYRARDLSLARVVALKVIRRELVGAGDRFEREVRAASRAAGANRHVVSVHDVGKIGGWSYLVMEFVESVGFDRNLVVERLRDGKAIARLVRAVSEAVADAHDCGVVHRDIKPQNVLIQASSDTLEPYLTDFGLAKILDEEDSLSHTGQVVGTLQYMAPEQTKGVVAPEGDIYSLGALLYFAMTGQPPFEWQTDAPDQAGLLSLIRRINDEEPVPPARLTAVTKETQDLETICLKCLHKDPKSRYSSARDLAADLTRYIDGEPIQARRVGPLGRASRWVKRKPALAGLAAALVLSVVVGGYGVVVNWLEARRNLQTVRRNHHASAVQAGHMAWNSGKLWRLDELLAETSGELYAEYHDFAWRYLRRLAEEAELGEPTHLGFGAAIRHNGDRLLTASSFEVGTWAKPDLSLVAEQSLEGTVAPNADGPRNRRVRFSADGTFVAAALGTGEVQLWVAASGQSKLTVRVDTVEAIAISPDNSRIVTVSRASALGIWNVDSAKKVGGMKLPHGLRARAVEYYPSGERIALATNAGLLVVDATTGGAVQFHLIDSGATEVAVSANSGVLATGHGSGDIGLWDANAVTRQGTLEAHRRFIYALAFSPDEKHLASGGHDTAVRVWDVATRREVAVSRVSRSPIRDLEFDPEETDHLSAVNSSGVLRRWDWRSPQGVKVSKLHLQTNSIAFTEEGAVVATGRKFRSENKLPGDLLTLNPETTRRQTVFQQSLRKPKETTLSRDGSLIAVAYSGIETGIGRSEVEVVETDTASVKRSVLMEGPPPSAVDFSTDGTLLAAASGSSAQPALPGSLYVWRVEGKGSRVVVEGTTGFSDMCFLGSDSIAVATTDGRVRFHDTAGSLRSEQTIGGAGRNTFLVVAAVPGRKAVAVGTIENMSFDSPGKIWIVDAAKEGAVKALGVHAKGVMDLHVSRNGERLASSDAGGQVKVWNLNLSKEEASFSYPAMATSVTWASDSATLYATIGQFDPTGSSNGEIRKIETATGKDELLHKAAAMVFVRAAEEPARPLLAYFDMNSNVGLLDPTNGKSIRTLNEAPKGHDQGITSIAVSPNGRTIASGGVDGLVCIWEATSGGLRRTFEHGGEEEVFCVSFSPDGRRLVSGTAGFTLSADYRGGSLRLWNVDTGELEQKVSSDEFGFDACLFSADGNRLIAWTSGGRTEGEGLSERLPRSPGVTVWDVRSRDVVDRFDVPGSLHSPIALCPKANLLAVGGNELFLIDLGSRSVDRVSVNRQDRINAVSFSVDGKILATTGDDSAVRLWRISTRQELLAFETPKGRGVAIAFSPDGRFLASSHEGENSVYFWQAESPRR